MNDCNSSSCVSVSHDIRIKVGIVGTISCCLSLLGCLFVIAIIITYKKYVFSVQRLILYLTITVIINVLGQLIQRLLFTYHGIDTDNFSKGICEAVAFISQYSAWGILLTLCCTMFELLIGVFHYTESGLRVHLVYILIIFVLPFSVNWIPFTIEAYGTTEWNCEIVVHKCCNRYTKGIVMVTLLWWVPLYTTLVYMTIGYATITLKLLYDKKRYTAMLELDRHQVYQNTYDDIMYLKYYPILYMLINVIPIASSIYDIVHQNDPCQRLWIVSALIKGIQGGIITVVAVLDPKTRKRLTFKQLKAAFAYNVMRRDVAEEYPIINSSISDSLHPAAGPLSS